MGFLEKLRSSSKDAFLGMFRESLRQKALSELASGKLTSPVSLDETCNRIIPALRRNPLTVLVLKMFRVSDTELRDLLREVFIEVGVGLK